MYHIMYTVPGGRRYVWGDYSSKEDAAAGLALLRHSSPRAYDATLVEAVVKAQTKMVSVPVETF